MNILVVGGAGYLGSAFLECLLPSNEAQLRSPATAVRVYDALVYDDYFPWGPPIEFVRGDVRDLDRLWPHLQWADAVVWLAAIVGDPACALDPVATRAINFDAFLEAARFEKYMVFVSTCSVYGARRDVLDENAPTAPLSLYAELKLAAENYCPGVSLRLGTLHGAGSLRARQRFDLVANTMTRDAVGTGKITLHGGAQCRPFTHVRDAAAVIWECLRYQPGGVFNISSENVAIDRIATLVAEEVEGTEIVRQSLGADRRDYVVSTVAAQRAQLLHAPYVDLKTGIAEMHQLLRSGRLRDPQDARYSNVQWLRVHPDRLLQEARA